MPRYNNRTRSRAPHRASDSEAETENQFVETEYAPKSDSPLNSLPIFTNYINSPKKGGLILTLLIIFAIIGGGYSAVLRNNHGIIVLKPPELNPSPDSTVTPSPTVSILPTLTPQIPTDYSSPQSTDKVPSQPNYGVNVSKASVPLTVIATRIYKKYRESVVMILVGEHRQGSGVIVSPNGVIVTNAHVIRGESKIKVKSAWGKTYDAVVSFTDEAADIAVVNIQSSEPLPCILPSNRSVAVGEIVFTLSNPWSIESALTFGMVSKIEKDSRIIHQSVIAAGSSGAPLFDENDNWIGINTALLDKVALYRAIPTSVLERLPIRPFCPAR